MVFLLEEHHCNNLHLVPLVLFRVLSKALAFSSIDVQDVCYHAALLGDTPTGMLLEYLENESMLATAIEHVPAKVNLSEFVLAVEYQWHLRL